MAVYSIIEKSELEGACRLDAEYYQPEYLENEKLLNRIGFSLIEDTGSVVYGTTPEGAAFVEKGIPFIRSQNFSNLTVDDLDIVYASEEFHKRNKKSTAKPGDILFAAVGATIGELAVIQKSINEANINQNIAKVRINKEFNPYFVGLFFASKIGQLQISRLVTGNAQAYLNSLQIKELKIPKVQLNKQKEISDYFIEIERELGCSKSLYSQAEDLLLQELGLNDFKGQDDLTFIVNLSDIKLANRMDADYFQPKYNAAIARIKKYNLKPLGELVTMKKGFEPGSDEYQEEGKVFLRVSNISRFGFTDKDQKYLSNELYQQLKGGFDPKTGDILLTKDATPGIAYVLKEVVEGIIASGIMRLKIKDDIDAEYLALCINSLVCQMQVERDAGGSIIVHWKPEQIKNLLIPILPKSTQQKIADLVRKSHEARKKVKELLEKSKKEIERIIEKA